VGRGRLQPRGSSKKSKGFTGRGRDAHMYTHANSHNSVGCDVYENGRGGEEEVEDDVYDDVDLDELIADLKRGVEWGSMDWKLDAKRSSSVSKDSGHIVRAAANVSADGPVQSDLQINTHNHMFEGEDTTVNDHSLSDEETETNIPVPCGSGSVLMSKSGSPVTVPARKEKRRSGKGRMLSPRADKNALKKKEKVCAGVFYVR